MNTRTRFWLGRGVEAGVIGLALGLAAAEPEEVPNVLEQRTAVAAMAEETVGALKGEIAIEHVEGWAVFSGDPLPVGLDPGIGRAERNTGESYILEISGAQHCAPRGYRQVLVFRDEDLFHEFRLGRVDGDVLEQVRVDDPEGRFFAFQVPTTTPQIRIEDTELRGCEFALNERLQKALVAKPSRYEEMVEEDDVDVDQN